MVLQIIGHLVTSKLLLYEIRNFDFLRVPRYRLVFRRLFLLIRHDHFKHPGFYKGLEIQLPFVEVI